MKHQGTVPIETQRLSLRRFTQEDIPLVFANWASNPHVTQYLVWSSHRTQAETTVMVERWLKGYRHKDFSEWAVVEKATGQLIGSIGLMGCGSRKQAEAGYCLGEDWWGRGYAAEALEAVLDFAFCQVGYASVMAKHAMENRASGRVMEKAGMSLLIGETMAVSTANGDFDCLVYEARRGRKRFPWEPGGWR